jgi:hypothetical protein
MPLPQLPAHATEPPVRPTVLPFLPPFPRQPGQRPLPDAIAVEQLPLPGAVRRLPLPESAPPYDQPAGQRHPVPRGSQARQAPPPGAQPPGAEQAEIPEDEAGAEPRRGAPPRRAPARGLPARGPGSGEWPSQFAQALAETLAGARPPRQITPWTTGQARRRITELGPTLSAGQRPLVRRVLLSAPASNIVEMTVIIGIGSQVRALAVRLEQTGPRRARGDREGHWVCTAIEAA